MNRIAVVALMALTPALAHADSVFLKGGGEIKGEIVEQTADVVVLEVGPGRITLPMRNVTRIVSSTTDLGVFHARAAALAPRDVNGWLSLARWAQARDLGTQAREAYERVLEADPYNVDAHLGLGHVRMGDSWMSVADANRARGLVEFEGTWMTSAERQDRMVERAAMAQERQSLREAEARAREAEARVREAEARARAAEAEMGQGSGSMSAGIPFPYVFGGGTIIGGPFPIGTPPRHRHHTPSEPPPPPPVRLRFPPPQNN
jgi:hypothetical protein